MSHFDLQSIGHAVNNLKSSDMSKLGESVRGGKDLILFYGKRLDHFLHLNINQVIFNTKGLLFFLTILVPFKGNLGSLIAV